MSESAAWDCSCGYSNIGPTCTHCGKPPNTAATERVTTYDPREDSSRPDRDVPMAVFMAAKDATYGAMSYLDMDWTAHRPVQGDAAPKVIAYWVAVAVMKALEAPSD